MTNDEGMTKTEQENESVESRICHWSIRACFVIRHSSFVIPFAFSLSIFAEPPPSAQDILASVRMRQAQQQIDLQGQLREKDFVIPFRLTQTGPMIRYSFADPE